MLPGRDAGRADRHKNTTGIDDAKTTTETTQTATTGEALKITETAQTTETVKTTTETTQTTTTGESPRTTETAQTTGTEMEASKVVNQQPDLHIEQQSQVKRDELEAQKDYDETMNNAVSKSVTPVRPSDAAACSYPSEGVPRWS